MNFNLNVQSRSTRSMEAVAEPSNAGSAKGTSVTSMLGATTEGMIVDSNQAVASGYASLITISSEREIKTPDSIFCEELVEDKESDEENENVEDQCKFLMSDRKREVFDISVIVQNKDGNTPIHCAVIEGDIGRVEELLTENSIPSYLCQKNHNGETPLHLAAQKNDLVCISKLVQNGASCEAQDKFGNTPLHLVGKVDKCDIKCGNLLLKSGANQANLKDKEDCTLLHVAARRGNAALIRILVDVDGINLNDVDDYGNTPLHSVIIMRDEESLNILIGAKDIVLDKQNRDGNIPLHYAVMSDNEEFVRKLLTIQLHQLDIMNNEGNTPINLAISRGYQGCSDVLQSVKNTQQKNDLLEQPLACSQIEERWSVPSRTSRTSRTSRIRMVLNSLMCHSSPHRK